jgi:hypothetical protein
MLRHGSTSSVPFTSELGMRGPLPLYPATGCACGSSSVQGQRLSLGHYPPDNQIERTLGTSTDQRSPTWYPRSLMQRAYAPFCDSLLPAVGAARRHSASISAPFLVGDARLVVLGETGPAAPCQEKPAEGGESHSGREMAPYRRSQGSQCYSEAPSRVPDAPGPGSFRSSSQSGRPRPPYSAWHRSDPSGKRAPPRSPLSCIARPSRITCSRPLLGGFYP